MLSVYHASAAVAVSRISYVECMPRWHVRERGECLIPCDDRLGRWTLSIVERSEMLNVSRERERVSARQTLTDR